jgi:Na+-driven multidrug efflux pump
LVGLEVAVWAMMGVVWELLTALTEGLGEAASVRVSFYLAEGLPVDASRLANKVTFLTYVLALTISSILLMAGPNIAVALTTDKTLQNLFGSLVGMTSLANVSMTFSQIYWSLAGAQGRFNMASASVLSCRWFLILPLASICIFGYEFDLVAVACAMAIGYAVAASTLAMFVFQTDWERLSREVQEDVGAITRACYPPVVQDNIHVVASSAIQQFGSDDDNDEDEEDEEEEEDEELENSSSSSTSFDGFDPPSDEDDD